MHIPFICSHLKKLVTVYCAFQVLLSPLPSHALEKATVQLKWLHHFQFAGYYAALEKGFYREAGLDVTLVEGGPMVEVEKSVVEGKADFGVGTSALLLHRAHGADLVVLGQIFQHSPAIFLVPRSTGIRSIADMAGRRFMYSNQHGDMLALLKKNGIEEKDITQIPHQGDPRDLIDGKADVMIAYSFNEPFIFEQVGEPYLTFSPMTYGIDFYGDNFFTTRKLTEDRPKFVAAFREATLRGWRYALSNKAEIADLILARYSKAKSRDWLLFEANQMETLIQPGLVEMGYQSPSRWQQIADEFTALGMLPAGFDPKAIIYEPRQRQDYRLLIISILVSGVIIAVLTGLVLVFRNLNRRLTDEVNDRRQSEAALATSERKYASIFNLMPDIVGITRLDDGTFQEVNRGFEKCSGWKREEVVGRTSLDFGLWSSEARARAVEIVKEKGHLENYEFIFTKRDGEKRHAVMFLSPIELEGTNFLFFMVRDVTDYIRAEDERLALERQLLHAQKLESLGVLAGGIAHDFNNILTAIMGNAELALLRLNPESPALDNLRRIETSAVRATDLARQMLAYSGKGKFVVEPIDLNRLVEEMGHMLEVSISKKAILRYNLEQPLPSVEADATQLRQIVMNLVINASEAIGNKSGVIAITTGCMYCDRSYINSVWLKENIAEGLYVYLEVADTGCGMNKETQVRIFDPFFTTKFTGRGLGMAAVLGIVRGHKGAIKVYSEKGKGSSFKILLPAGNKPAELFNCDSLTDNWKGSGTVLLVDDEETIRAIGREMLQELGFDVITAGDGREALEIYTSRNDISFVILDLTMPHLDGEQTFRELGKLSNDVKVVISSGYSEYEVSQKFAGKRLAGFIQKPYKLSVLREVTKKLNGV